MRKLLAARLRSLAGRLDPPPAARSQAFYTTASTNTACAFPATVTWTSWPQS